MTMTRRQFIESQGATCRNWNWSWSFINEAEKFIIFGIWDIYDGAEMSLIFSEDWEFDHNRRRKPGYAQSREHIRLIEEKGYKLKTYPLEYMAAYEGKDAPARIRRFIPKLTDKKLVHIGKNWYASIGTQGTRLPEEVDEKEVFKKKFMEGASTTITINSYERNREARQKCLAHHGYKCAVCSFGFEDKYGEMGKNYIQVHHVIPISEIKKEYELDPIKDLIPVCPNCHAMIHMTRPALSIDQLKQAIEKKQAKCMLGIPQQSRS